MLCRTREWKCVASGRKCVRSVYSAICCRLSDMVGNSIGTNNNDININIVCAYFTNSKKSMPYSCTT